MIPFFPKQIAYRAIIVYLVALVAVSLVYFQYAMKIEYMVIGILCVGCFFLCVSNWSKDWKTLSEKRFLQRILGIAFTIRLIWIVVSYFYYIRVTGIPFEFGAADSLGYHSEAAWLASEPWSFIWDYYVNSGAVSISDAGYPIYLIILYKAFGPVIIIPRIVKAILSTFMCYLVYRICYRTFEESTARISVLMCALMPNLIIYCGYHLKETEMLFLEVFFLDRADYLFRSRKTYFFNILFPTLLIGVLFLFRTVLGMAAIFAFATAVLFSSTPSMKKGWKRVAIIGWGLLCVIVAGGGVISTEIEGLWEDREDNVSRKRLEQVSRGNQWAQYATGTVMAPMMLFLPFSTMVDVDQQYGQQEKHGGNYIRNFMGFFAFLAIIEAIRRKKWRDFSLIGAFAIAYLGVVSLSGFSNSERFLLPGLPCLIIMWAYGISALRKQTYKFMMPWCVIVGVMEIAWGFFKLGSRGLF